MAWPAEAGSTAGARGRRVPTERVAGSLVVPPLALLTWPSEAGSIAGAGGRSVPSKPGKRSRTLPFSPQITWPSEAGSIASGSSGRSVPSVPGRRSRLFLPSVFRGKVYHEARGLYRIFNAAEYRFYRTNGSPPAEGDSPLDTNTTLPHTPADVYGDGDWYLSVSYFNGVIDSGFLPLGDNGETYLRMPLSGGAETGVPPQAPHDARLSLEAGGVVRAHALYFQSGSLRADTWAIAYTVDGSAPPESTPDDTETMATAGLAILSYAIPAQVGGTVVKVRVQSLRGTVYSEGSAILSATADDTGPTVPTYGESWPGGLGEEA